MLLLALIHSALAGMPVKETSWDVEVSGPLADIWVEQTFTNDGEQFLEATYVFPLDHDAAVDAMSIVIGDREVVGVVRERDAARRDYEAARDEGQVAALTEQERPNVFTQQVANIPPGEDVVVRLHVVQPLNRVDGAYELVLPLVVGPRFVPEGVADAGRITPPVSEEDTGLRVDVDVDIAMGLPLASLLSPSHDLGPGSFVDGQHAAAHLRAVPATRDVVLRWTPEVERPEAAVLRQGSHLLLDLEPPEAPPRDHVVPRELVFVIDTSCSQMGQPMDRSRRSMHRIFDGLDERDSFLVLDFADSASMLSPAPLAATPDNLRRGRAYVDGFAASGGTNMMAGVRAAFDAPSDPDRERYVAFFTDGYIGNEREILGAIEDARGGAKVFVFGIGNSTNRWLLDEMGRTGAGRTVFIPLHDAPEEAMDTFLDSLDQPVLADIAIDWGDWEVDEIYPQRLPDLVAGQPLDVSARVSAVGTTPITVSGRLGDGWFEQAVQVTPAPSEQSRAVPVTWARRRLAALDRQQHWGEIPEVRQAMLGTALEYGLLSRYTSFLAVERTVRNTSGELHRVEQPLDIPDGVDFHASVSRKYTPPGDPLLTVDAPEDARSVMAVYPWGQGGLMRWDELRSRWYDRFLVPRDVEDGVIEVVIFVVLADGRIERRVQEMVVDGEAPELDVDIELIEGRTRLTLWAREPLRSIQANSLGVPGVSNRLELYPEDDRYKHIVELPGHHCRVELVVKDKAMNTVVEVVECSR